MLTNQTNSPTTRFKINQLRGSLPPAAKPVISNKSRAISNDDLKIIKGIGSVIEKALNAEGIYHYRQIASFNAAKVNWVNNHLAFSGRIEREDWIGQAKRLAADQVPKNHNGDVSNAMKPALLSEPINGTPDDFKRIKGIGLVLEQALQELGLYHYHQLATLTTENAKWVEHHVGFPGRVKRENWTAQARSLAAGKVTEYSNRFDKGKTPYKS